MATATVPKDDIKFTIYPQAADDFFQKNQIVISCLPKNIVTFGETKSYEVLVGSAKQYEEILNKEIDFWNENDPLNKFRDYTQINSLNTAKTNFDRAISYYNTPGNVSSADSIMQQSINSISNGFISSKTRLAKTLLSHKDKSADFITGFMRGLASNGNVSVSTTADSLSGFIASMQYRALVKSFVAATKTDLIELENNISDANENYCRLNSNYTEAFHTQEERFAGLVAHTDKFMDDLNKSAEEYFSEKQKRCDELENLYEEKLKLQAPAQYWDQMEADYEKKGKHWLIGSVVVMVAIIVSLILVLALLPNLFSTDSHWIDVFKNSAIITVIMSIAVYVLRLCVRMSTSSYHLARDAKERSKLTYFYLALIEKKAITEKERAIVLNSLFSRADTGLLKGDSSPTMSGNITELVDSLKK